MNVVAAPGAVPAYNGKPSLTSVEVMQLEL
jgi:hypothetical protein